MLQPTPHLLLRPAAASLAKLWTHPKVPLTTSESHQLLNIIKTSFRQQLDQEHGNNSPEPAPSGSSPKPSTLNAELPKSVMKTQPISNAPPIATPTDRHIRHILTNPLFSFEARRKPTGARDPMDVFDEACASGLMTVDRARACLLAKKRALGGSLNGLRASGAGVKVFKWLLSTGVANDSSWLLQEQQKGRSDIIFEFLILEGRQELLWDLFEHYIVHPQQWADLLIYHLSKDLGYLCSLDSAYECLIRANEILDRSGVSEARRQAILRIAVHKLISTTTHGAPASTRPLSPTLFDRFLDIVEVVVPPAPTPSKFKSRLHLCHPTKPDAKPALQYLKSLDETISERLISEPYFVEPESTSSTYVVWLALESAKLLLKHEKYEDARWVMGFLQRRYPEVIGAGQKTVVKAKTEAEAMNVQLLMLSLGGT